MGRLRLPAGFRAVSFLCAGLLACLVFVTGLAAQQTTSSGPRIWLQEPRSLPVKYVAAAVGASSGATGAAQNVNDGAAQILASGQGQPLAMATGDFDGDGVTDLVVGYAVPGGGVLAFHRGNLDAFAPQSDASFQAIGRGQFPSPFLPGVQVTSVAVRPDFLAVGNFTGQGNLDLVVAARGGNAIYLFPGNGTGKFANPQIITLTGGITALAAGNLGNGHSLTNLAVGISGPNNSFSFVILGETGLGLGVVANYSLSAPASNILFGDFGAGTDATFISGGQIQILRSNTMQLATVSLPVSASAFALGSFIYDRNGGSQIALLAPDGSVQIAVRNEFDPRVYTAAEFNAIRQAKLNHQPPPSFFPARSYPMNGWKIVESLPGVAYLNSGQTPVFFRTRVSSNGADDVMVLNALSGQLALISHPDLQPGAQTFLPGQVALRPYSGSPVAALSMRINVDGRPGIMALHQGQIAPLVVMPIPDPTFRVNTTNDTLSAGACLAATPNQCSLREAIVEANATPGTDTIMVPAGTYTLTRGRIASPLYDANDGTLNINDSVNIVGTVDGGGNPTSIITWGTLTSGNSVDMVMAVNEDLPAPTDATASISNVIIQNGVNHGAHNNDGDGGCMEFDTGTIGTATLSLTNVTIQNCATTQGGGGGLVTFAFVNPAGGGTSTISNSLFQNNSAVDSVAGTEGGGIAISAGSLTTITNTQVKNNNSNHVVSSQAGIGGGIALDASGGTPGHLGSLTLHASTISGNTAGGLGGGISDLGMSLSVDQGTIISGNSAGLAGIPNTLDGGGVYLNTGATGCPGSCPNTVSFNKVTIIGNSATGNGGGISNGSGSASGPLAMSFSRLAGNTAAAGSNLNNNHATATVTNNWWGTNNASSTINSISATTTFDPWITLTNTASPGITKVGGATSTVTASFLQDNHNTAIAASNLDVLIGLPVPPPIFPATAVHGTLSSVQTQIQANGQATEVFTPTTAGVETINASVDSASVPATIAVLFPPSISKAFGATNIPVNGITALTFTITNPNTANSLNGLDFTDNLPAGLVIANTPNVVNACGGTVTATAGTSLISLSGGTVNQNTNCTVAVDVKGITDGMQNNTSGNVTATDAGGLTGNTASASLTVINPPTISKAFGAATIPQNGTTSLIFTFSNTNGSTTLNGIAASDTFPAGLVVATLGNVVSTCNGSGSAPDGASTVSLSGASLAPGASCTVTMNVTGTTAGVKNNTSGNVTATDAGGITGNTANASITVIAPPTISKAFAAASIPLDNTTTTILTFTISNAPANTTATLSGIAFTDTLPTGLKLNSTQVTGNICPGSPTITATVNNPPGTPSTVSFSGGTLPVAPSSCHFNVTVIGVAAGDQPNTTSTITSTEGGTGATSNTAILTVVAPPSIAKAFGAAAIPVNVTTTLTFTITNPAANTTAENGIAFSDTLTNGLQVAGAPGVSNTCGGSVTATANTTTISLSGGSIATPNTTCTIVVNVTGTQSGTVSNTTGAVSSTNGGTGATSNTANLIVANPPTITKAFGAASIPRDGTTSLTLTITNPNTGVGLTGIAFTDNLPPGLLAANPSNLSNNCGGTATGAAGASAITLSGGTLAASASCVLSVDVVGLSAGVKNNTTGAISSTEGGLGATSNTASVTVVFPPSLSKAFGAVSIPLNGPPTTLTFTLASVNATTALTGIGFSDTLPAGLIISTPNGLSNTCGGTVTAVQGTNVISLLGGTLAASGSCGIAVNVTGTTAGTKNNTTGNVTSTEGGTGGAFSASIDVVAPPAIAKQFGAASIALNGTTSLTFTLTNPPANAVAESGVAFTDTLPAGLVVATPNGLTNTCGGTATAVAGSGSISLAGGAVAASSTCTVTVNITGTASANYTNTTGAVTSTNGGTGNTASATLTVASPPTITKSFNPTTIFLSQNSTLSFMIQNPNTSVSLTGVAFTDTLPAGLVVANPNGLTGACGGGTITATAGAGTISLSGATLAANASCTFSVNVTGTSASVKNNSVQVTSSEGGTGNTSNASITVNAATPPTISKSFAQSAIGQGSTVLLSITIVNPNSNPNPNITLTGIAFTDNLPSGLAVNFSTLNTDCGGTLTTTPSSITLTAGAIAPGAPPPPSRGRRGEPSPSTRRTGAGSTAAGFCTVNASLLVSGSGKLSNITGPVSANESGPGAVSNTASLDVIQAPTVAKAFGAASIPLNGSTSLTFNFSNPNATTSLVGIALNDTLPSGLVVANPNGLGGTCSADVTANPGSNSIAVVNLVVAGAASCTVVVNVTGISGGTKNNTTGNVTATFDDGSGTFLPVTGGTASAPVVVVAPPSIAKSFNPTAIAVNGTSTLTITITNPAANTVAEAGLAFTDTLPASMVVATPNGLTNTCGGTPTATAGSGSVSLTGGTVAAAGICKLTVNVTASSTGNFTNTTGAVSSTNGSTGNTATANLTVQPADLTITKTHTGNFSRGQTGATYTITVTNSGQGPTVGTVTVVDTLPNVPNTLVATAMSGTGWTCTLGTLTCTRSDVLAPAGSYPPITLTVNVPLNIQANVTNTATVSGGGETNTGNDTASDQTHIGPPIQITFNVSTLTVSRGSSASTTFTVDSSAGEGTINFSCSGLPAGSSCSFNPPSESQLTATVTLTIATSAGSASALPFGGEGKTPVFAVLIPLLGLVGIGLSAGKGKKARLRLVLCLGGLMFLLATFAGCAGGPRGTPTGAFQITVTATSASTRDSGTATITLNVL
jgi:CSLREA domain-containing protein/uncharacterized repeat protein (TIGR01451 family)